MPDKQIELKRWLTQTCIGYQQPDFKPVLAGTALLTDGTTCNVWRVGLGEIEFSEPRIDIPQEANSVEGESYV